MSDLSPPERFIDLAVDEALRSPCKKSRRGSAIWDFVDVIAVGHNHPPPSFSCTGSRSCREHCNKLCVHAEEHALLRAGANVAHGTQMLHIKIDDEGNPVPSGPPSCWQCSRAILELGVVVMWLLEEENGKPRWVPYSAFDFHATTLENCGLLA